MFLVARKYHQNECIVHEEKDGEKAEALAESLARKAFALGIQILKAQDISTYNEYQDYEMIDDEEEFVSRVLAM